MKTSNKPKTYAQRLASRLQQQLLHHEIDFTPTGVSARWRAGYDDMRGRLAEACWLNAVDAIDGVIVHDVPGPRANAGD